MHVKQRLGFSLPQPRHREESLWIHAVSVGEVLSLRKLVKQLKERHSAWGIDFSSLTPTGMRMAEEKLEGVDNFFFIPLDFSPIVGKFFQTYNPKVFILAESEFWPNLLRVARENGAAVLLINGRVSERSFRRYRLFKFLAKKIFKNIDLFLAQTDLDRERLERIGVEPGRIRVVGNLKAEIELPVFSQEEITSLRKELNIQERNKVIVAGSTRKGEEDELLKAYLEARQKRDDLKLILVPRHLERVIEVERICQRYALSVKRWTKLSSDEEWEVLILDTMGELAQLYALSDIAFVGGSLVPWGGHNLLEPAFYAKPVFFGPHMDNFAYFADIFVRSGAARIMHNRRDLAEAFLNIDGEELSEMGKRAKDALLSLQGATEKTMQAIEALMRR